MNDVTEISQNLMSYIYDKNELFNLETSELNKIIVTKLKECLCYCLQSRIEIKDSNKLLEIECVLDFLHDELNTGHWSEVPLCIRRCFSIASFTKCVILLVNKEAEEKLELLLKTCLKCLDIGLIMGAPLENNTELLTNSAKYLIGQVNELSSESTQDNRLDRKRKPELFHSDFSVLKGTLIDSIELPAVEHFNKKYFLPQRPVKLTGCMKHWPATEKWLDINYLLRVAGDRTVPIELGSHYVDENWSQKLMTLKDFITRHYLSDDGGMGYLAQHNLFEQITELKEDIHVPEYCCLSTDYENCTDPDVNAWFGPKNTVSPLHQDPKNNILAQVYGTKQLILFSPKDTPYVYPHDDKYLFNTARVDPLKPDLEKYPEFTKATLYKCLLEPGEMLFIPEGWWHHVTALEKSFSVSFWWQ